ncbi:MAG: hypothetical protein QXI71_01025 [Candidatus Bathyarchaeia archaeon]
MRVELEFNAFSLDPKSESIEDLGVIFSFNSHPSTHNEILLADEIAAFMVILFIFNIYHKNKDKRRKGILQDSA